MKRYISAVVGVILVSALPMHVHGATAQGVPNLASLPQCQSVTAGTVHVVDSPIGSVTSVEPPSGFSPTDATAAELRCYSFPQRPTDPRQLAQWTRVMAHPRHYVVPQFGPPVPSHQSTTSSPSTTSPSTISPSTISGAPVKDYYESCVVGGSKCLSAPWAGYAIPSSKNTGWNNLQWTEA